jgi:hypothetical protein
MQKFAFLFMPAALLLYAAIFVVPAPAHACNIANPPIPCANVPGSNPVAGLGTLHQNQFQSVPGLNPYRFRSSGLPSPLRRFGSRDPIDGLMAPSQRDTYVVPSFGPDSGPGSSGGNFPIPATDPLPSVDPSAVRPINPNNREQARAINTEMENIIRDFYTDSDGEEVNDYVLGWQLSGFLSIEERDDKARLEESRTKGGTPGNPARGLFRVDNQSIEADDGSVLDDIESFFVAM